MRKTLPFIVIALCAALWVRYFDTSNSASPAPATNVRADEVIADAFTDRRSNLQVRGTGVVARILADDNHGDRHQRFVLELDSGQTVLVAHNIDLAPRISGLRSGDRVSFFGEYEWNEQGGVIHWTHHDPENRHVGGWLEHNDEKYE